MQMSSRLGVLVVYLTCASLASAQAPSSRTTVVEKLGEHEAIALPASIPEGCDVPVDPSETQSHYMQRVATCFERQGHPEVSLWLLRVADDLVSKENDEQALAAFKQDVARVESRLGRVELKAGPSLEKSLKNRSFMFDGGHLDAETGLQVWAAPGKQELEVAGQRMNVDVWAGRIRRFDLQQKVGLEDRSEKMMEWAFQEAARKKPIARQGWQVPVYFVTNRRNTGSAQKPSFQGADADKLSYGTQDVTLLQRATSLIGAKSTTVQSDVSLLSGSTTLVDEGRFMKTVCDEWPEGATPRRLLLFIHGYSNDFEDGVLSAGEVAANVEFQGKALHYSWPSQGSVSRYFRDEEMEEGSRAEFVQFLQALQAKCKGVELYLFAHSMGNRLLLHGLGQLGEPTDAPKVAEVISAAADVAQNDYLVSVNGMTQRPFRRLTLYASSEDHALFLSQIAHWGKKRAGQCSADAILLGAGFHSVDATEAHEGHGYYRKSPLAARDFKQVLLGAEPVYPPRTVAKRQRGDAWFWLMVAEGKTP